MNMLPWIAPGSDVRLPREGAARGNPAMERRGRQTSARVACTVWQCLDAMQTVSGHQAPASIFP
eukprot:620075-Pleurochrysis_carterae.AAC.4